MIWFFGRKHEAAVQEDHIYLPPTLLISLLFQGPTQRPVYRSALWEDHAAAAAAPPDRSPVEFEVRREDEFSRVVHGPPHQAQHQDLQPAALQQVDLVGQTQLHEP